MCVKPAYFIGKYSGFRGRHFTVLKITQMKGINTPGQALERGGVASFSAPRALYLTLLSQHSLGNGTMLMLLLLSLRWGMKGYLIIPKGFQDFSYIQGYPILYAQSSLEVCLCRYVCLDTKGHYHSLYPYMFLHIIKLQGVIRGKSC